MQVLVHNKYLAILKGDHKYIFRYLPGEEQVVLRRVLDYVRDCDCDIDWKDVLKVLRTINVDSRKGVNNA